MTNVYPKSTVEMIYLPMTNNGTIVTTNVTYSVVLEVPGTPAAEGTHSPATIQNGKTGVLLTGLAVGTYRVWGAVDTGAEHPHVYLGTFKIVN